jgi:predicted metal-dependent hydrolase
MVQPCFSLHFFLCHIGLLLDASFQVFAGMLAIFVLWLFIFLFKEDDAHTTERTPKRWLPQKTWLSPGFFTMLVRCFPSLVDWGRPALQPESVQDLNTWYLH